MRRVESLVESDREGVGLRRFERAFLLVVLMLAFLPYVGLGPLNAGSQVQPWAGLAAWLWVALRVLTSTFRVSARSWPLIIFATWAMLFVYQSGTLEASDYWRRSSAYLLSAGILLAAQFATPRLVWSALKFTLPVWLVFAALRYVSPTMYFAVVTPLVPTVVVSDERGSSSLAPEATDFGFTMAFLLAIGLIVYRRLKEAGDQPRRWPLMFALLGAILSQAGTAVFGLAAVAAIYLATRPIGRSGRVGRAFSVIGVAVVAFVGLALVGESDIRGLNLLTSALQSPAALLEGTFSYRIAHNLVGLHALLDTNLVGYGAGSFLQEAYSTYVRHDVGTTLGLTGYYANNVPLTLTQSPVSQIAVLMLEYGAVGLAYVAIVLVFVSRSAMPYRGMAAVMIFLAWIQSFPAAWPPVWVLIGIALSSYRREQKQ